MAAGRFSGILYDDHGGYSATSHEAWDELPEEHSSTRRPFNARLLLPLFFVVLGLAGYAGWRVFAGPTSDVQAVVESLGSTASVVDDGTTGQPGAVEATDGGDDGSPQLPVSGDGDEAIAAGDVEQTTTTAPPATTVPTDGSVIYYNDFSSGSLGPEWEQYDSIGNGGWGLRRPSAISIISDPTATSGGKCLAITAKMGTGDEAGQLVSGGLKLIGHSQTYGKYTVRVRVDDDPDQVTNGVSLLWPSDNIWPQGGEINIVENFYNRDTRSPVESRLHWMKPDAEPPFDREDDALIQVDHPIDGTDWHVYTLEWREDSVTVAVDDGPPRRLSTGDALIPQWDMDITFQLDGLDPPGTGIQPVINGEVSMCVDYVQVERL